jgi:tryptophan halogenase
MNIVILGGGSAGWMTALLVQKYYPNENISLIESEEIGILGAGEGTTPQFKEFLSLVNISPSNLIVKCKATLKLGINFKNWNGDNLQHMHSFSKDHDIDPFTLHNGNLVNHCVNIGNAIDILDFPALCARNKKVPFTPISNPSCLDSDPLQSFLKHSDWALHFDAVELAKYFRSVAESRGIKRVEGKLVSSEQDFSGNITKLLLENGNIVSSDFVFDCSGFARLLIGKLFNTEWKSYKEHLPLDTAIPFFIEHDNDIEPQTDCIAMKYGWQWKIPVNGRYGCGYVFSSVYINEEQALEEIREMYGDKITSPRVFKFNPGSFTKTLVNNCMAVGLAQSFVEPLEATSIWVSYSNLKEFLDNNGISNKSSLFIKTFNEQCISKNQSVVGFLNAHYHTKRNDTLFWKEFKQKHPMMENAKKLFDLAGTCNTSIVHDPLFPKMSWLQVGHPIGLVNLVDNSTQINKSDNLNNVLENFMQNHINVLRGCILHKEFIEYTQALYERKRQNENRN